MSKFDQERVSHLLQRLKEFGAVPTEKAMLALFHAHSDATGTGAREILDGHLLAGVLRSHGVLNSLFWELGLSPNEVVNLARPAQVPRSRKREGSQQSGKPKRPRRRLNDGYIGRKSHDEGRRLLDDFSGEVSTEELAVRAIRGPHVWRAINLFGVSVNKLRSHCTALRVIEPDIETQKLVVAADKDRISVELCEFEGAGAIEGGVVDTGLILPVRLVSLPTRDHILGEAVDRFEWLVNQPRVSEAKIQKFLEDHPRFLLGLEHKQLHSQLTLVRDDQADLRPDFFLERLDGNMCDIVELKLPREKLVVGKPNRRTFSAAIISALGQLREYRNFFDDRSYRKWFHGKYGLDAYKPRIQVVIGRSADYLDSFERYSLREQLTHLEVLTFDDIIRRMRYAAQVASWA